MAATKNQVKKAVQDSLAYANEITKGFEGFDKERLYAGMRALKGVMEEDPMLEKVLGDSFDTYRQQLAFIARNSGVRKNAGNAQRAADEILPILERVMTTEK